VSRPRDGGGPATGNDLAARRRARHQALRDTGQHNLGADLGQIAETFASKAGNKPLAARAHAQRVAAETHPDRKRLNRIKSPEERFREVDKAQGAGPNPVGLGRVVLHGTGAVVEELATHPLRSVAKTAGFVKDTAKGVASAAIGLPVYAAEYPIAKGLDAVGLNRRSGKDKAPDDPLKIAKRMLSTQGEHFKVKYGPSYAGKPGAFKRLKKIVHEEGPAATALDIATAVAPGSSVIGGTTRKIGEAQAARGATNTLTQRAAARTTAEGRPAIKREALKPGEKQRARRSAIGATVAYSHDAARGAVQRVAVARSKKRLRARAVQRVTGRDITRDRADVKARFTNTKPKPLRLDRTMLKPGEVAPISSTRLNRTARIRTATTVTRGKQEAAWDREHLITGAKGDTLYVHAKALPPELHHAALKAAQLGIVDAASARRILPKRIAEIKRNRAEALVGGHGAAAEAHAAGEAGELAKLEALLAKPEVFDDARVHAAAESIDKVTRAVTPKDALNADRAALGRAAPLGRTLGVIPRAEEHAAARAAHEEARTMSAAAIKAARADREKARATGARVLAGARADLAKAKGRAEILSRNVSGKERIPGDKETGRGPSYAAGGHGVRQAEEALAKAQARVADEVSAATERLQAARAAHKELRQQLGLKRINETGLEYEARVAAAAAEHGLRPPAYVPSRFERDGAPVEGVYKAPPGSLGNPLSKGRKGTLYDLGREDTTLGDVARVVAAEKRRGSMYAAEGRVLEQHGIPFVNDAVARKWAEQHGLKWEKDGDQQYRIWQQAAHAKGDPPPPVWVVPPAVADELKALNKREADGPSKLAVLSHGPQAVILATRPAWFGFQRINDAVALLLGGAAPDVLKLNALRRELDPDELRTVHIMSGGSFSNETLGPRAIDNLGNLQRVMDENTLYARAMARQNPLTALLRLDQKITGTARELQYLKNLKDIARELDPAVRSVWEAYKPMGRAFKEGDIAKVRELLTDPKYAAERERAAQQLYKIHGDWHNFTAREGKFKGAAAFYGFLRYATRMALFTLPLTHPYVGMLVGQLGQMGANDFKKIAGPDVPWGIGTVLNANGTIAADLTRANPIAGPLVSIDDPAKALSVATPLAGILANYLLGQNVALSNSSEGRPKQLTFHGDPKDHAAGNLISEQRVRYGLNQLASLVGPYAAARKNLDTRQQSDDSLVGSRRRLQSTSPTKQLDINTRNDAAKGAGGWLGFLRDQAPWLVAGGSGKNLAEIGKSATAARKSAEEAQRLEDAKREGMKTTRGELQMRRELRRLQFEKLREERAPEGRAELELRRKLRVAQRGG
jgi:hypothetical protein